MFFLREEFWKKVNWRIKKIIGIKNRCKDMFNIIMENILFDYNYDG